MRKSDPVSIDAGRSKAKPRGRTIKHSAAEREKAPSPAKRSRTRHSAAKSDKAPPSRRSSKRDTAKRDTAKSATSNKSAAKAAAHSMKNPVSNDPPRLPENHHPGLHDRSYAAHLDADPREPHTKPAGDLRFLAPFPTGRKQP